MSTCQTAQLEVWDDPTKPGRYCLRWVIPGEITGNASDDVSYPTIKAAIAAGERLYRETATRHRPARLTPRETEEAFARGWNLGRALAKKGT